MRILLVLLLSHVVKAPAHAQEQLSQPLILVGIVKTNCNQDSCELRTFFNNLVLSPSYGQLSLSGMIVGCDLRELDSFSPGSGRLLPGSRKFVIHRRVVDANLEFGVVILDVDNTTYNRETETFIEADYEFLKGDQGFWHKGSRYFWFGCEHQQELMKPDG